MSIQTMQIDVFLNDKFFCAKVQIAILKNVTSSISVLSLSLRIHFWDLYILLICKYIFGSRSSRK